MGLDVERKTRFEVRLAELLKECAAIAVALPGIEFGDSPEKHQNS